MRGTYQDFTREVWGLLWRLFVGIVGMVVIVIMMFLAIIGAMVLGLIT